MRDIIKILTIILISCVPQIQAQDSVHYEASEIRYLEMDQRQLDTYRNDPDFSYELKEPKNAGWWDRFISWIQRNLLAVIHGTGDSGVGTWLFYILGGLAFLFAILKIMGMDLQKVLRKHSGKAEVAPHDITHQDIHTIDFEDVIEDHIQRREYRQAIRLFYLYALKLLTDKEQIQWRAGKTNREYMAEIAETPYSSSFGNLSYYFEYIWYGNFGVPESLFSRVQEIFNQLNHQLERH